MEHLESHRWQASVRHLLAVHRPEQAEQLARRWLASHPEEAAAHCLLALTLLNQDERTAEGLTVIRQAIALDPQQDQAHYFHSVFLLRSNQAFEALQAITEALRLNARNATYQGYKAVIANSAWRSEEALEATAAGLSIFPGHLECLYQRVVALRHLGRSQDAAATVRRLTYWHPNHAIAHQLRGEEALGEQQLLAAESHFREAIRLRPTSEKLRKSLQEVLERQAESAFDQHQLLQAVVLYQDILLLEPHQPVATRKLRDARLLQHWSQQPFLWLQHRRTIFPAARNLPLLKRLPQPLLLAFPLLLALGARAILQVRYVTAGPEPLQEDSWFYAGLLWAAATFGLALFPPIPLPALWLAVTGGLVFSLRNSYLKWRQGIRKWPLGATLLLSPGSMALVNGHSNWLNPDGATEAGHFLACFAALLLVYQVLCPIHQPTRTLLS